MIGIELSKKYIRFAVWNGRTVTRIFMADMPTGVYADGKIENPDVLSEVIRRAIKKERIHATKVAFVLPERCSYLVQLSMPYMTEKQLHINLPYEFRDYMSEDADHYYFDSFLAKVYKGENGKPEKADYYAAAILKDLLNEYKKMFKKAGLKMVIALPCEIALINIIRLINKDEEGESVFVGLESDRTRIDIFKGSSFICSKTTDEGYELGTDIDNDIYERIAANIKRVIDFYGFSNRDSKIQKIYLYGSGTYIPNYVGTIKELLGTKVCRLSELFPAASNATARVDCYVMPIGAAIQKNKQGLATLNLVPREGIGFKKLLILLLIALLIVGLGYSSQFVIASRFSKLSEEQASLAQRKLTLENYEKAVKPYSKIKKEYNQYNVSWKTDSEKTLVPVTEILDMLDEVLGNKVASIQISATTVTLRIIGVELTSASTVVERFMSYPHVSNVTITQATSGSGEKGIAEMIMIIQMDGTKGGSK